MNRSAFVCFVSLLLCVLSIGWTSELDQVADALDRHYNALQSIRASFDEHYRGAGILRDESGTVLLTHSGRMRWEYRRPHEKLFLSDGKIAYFYVPGEQQARKAPIEALDDLRTPLRYLLGKARIRKEFEGIVLNRAPNGHVLLRGVPKGMKDRVTETTLEINERDQIERIVIEELDGSQTEFVFRDIQENVPTSDSSFRFQPPAGVQVLDMEALTH